MGAATREQADTGLAGDHAGVGDVGFALEGVGAGQRFLCKID